MIERGCYLPTDGLFGDEGMICITMMHISYFRFSFKRCKMHDGIKNAYMCYIRKKEILRAYYDYLHTDASFTLQKFTQDVSLFRRMSQKATSGERISSMVHST